MTILRLGPTGTVERSRAVKSSNLVIGAASAFVALSALASLIQERDPAGLPPHGAMASKAWALRGAITPVEFGWRPAHSRPGVGSDAV